jgi:hypothetical protein
MFPVHRVIVFREEVNAHKFGIATHNVELLSELACPADS